MRNFKVTVNGTTYDVAVEETGSAIAAETPVVAAPASPAAAPAPAPAAKPEPVLAAGTAGELKLHDVAPKDAAMIMAVVAYKLGKPLNELRFKSIKEVK